MPAIEPRSRDDWKRFCRRVSVQAQFFTLDDVCLWTQSKSCEHIYCVCRYRGKVPGGGLSEGRAGCHGLGSRELGAVAVVETACSNNEFLSNMVSIDTTSNAISLMFLC